MDEMGSGEEVCGVDYSFIVAAISKSVRRFREI